VVSLLDVLMPPSCAGCGRSGSALCSTCTASFVAASDPRTRFAAADPGVVVGEALWVSIAAFAYQDALRRALQRLKYAGASRLAEPLAAAASAHLRRLLAICGRLPLAPVPIHPERARTRGYNQAELLARALGRRTGLPVIEPLVRLRPTTRQHRLDRVARLHNLRQAFAVKPGTRAPPAVILVDDILTTSATLESCAAALAAAGTHAVYGFAIAREV
jgi:ComF family protein